jgi:hypothetical protein
MKAVLLAAGEDRASARHFAPAETDSHDCPPAGPQPRCDHRLPHQPQNRLLFWLLQKRLFTLTGGFRNFVRILDVGPPRPLPR